MRDHQQYLSFLPLLRVTMLLKPWLWNNLTTQYGQVCTVVASYPGPFSSSSKGLGTRLVLWIIHQKRSKGYNHVSVKMKFMQKGAGVVLLWLQSKDTKNCTVTIATDVSVTCLWDPIHKPARIKVKVIKQFPCIVSVILGCPGISHH